MAGNLGDGQRVMTRIAVKKAHLQAGVDVVRVAEAEHVHVERCGRLEVRDHQHKVPETLVARDKARHVLSRRERLVTRQLSVRQLVTKPRLIVEPRDSGYATRPGEGFVAGVGVYTGGGKACHTSLQEGFVAHVPADEVELVAFSRLHGDTPGSIVDSEPYTFIASSGDELGPENLFSKLGPCAGMGRREADVAEGFDHVVLLCGSVRYLEHDGRARFDVEGVVGPGAVNGVCRVADVRTACAQIAPEPFERAG